MRKALAWLGRKAILFGLIVAALVTWQLTRASYQSYSELSAQIANLASRADALPAYTTAAVDSSNRAVDEARRDSVDQLDGRITAAEQEKAALIARQIDDARALLTGGVEEVLKNRQNDVRIRLLSREIASLRALRKTAGFRGGLRLTAAIQMQTRIMRDAADKIKADVTALRNLRRQGRVRQIFNGSRRQGLVDQISEQNKRGNQARNRAYQLLEARDKIRSAASDAQVGIGSIKQEFDKFLTSKRRELAGTAPERLRGWAERVGLADKARAALLIVFAIVLTPLLIRTLFYYVLAPIAARRPAIRFRASAGADTALLAPGERSAVSLGVRLGPGEELLVRQGFLQASSVGGEKRTRWLLDWRHPLTSLAAGLWFLTRVRGNTDDVATVSAIADPFAEIAELALPPGAALVLHPRALVAVAQPVAQPLRITSHWRLGSLNAWLTLQLRYLLFHGPARLVVKGGRGVRIEPAARGRIFGQDQLVGFSADLAYSVTRTETFWPYLLGQESLLKDRVIDGGGVLVVEEAPLAARGGKGVRGGLEGAFDAALKVFGV